MEVTAAKKLEIEGGSSDKGGVTVGVEVLVPHSVNPSQIFEPLGWGSKWKIGWLNISMKITALEPHLIEPLQLHKVQFGEF